MSMSEEEYQELRYIDDSIAEQEKLVSAKSQTIYLLVEGHCEDIYFRQRLNLSFEDIGLRIINYKGIDKLQYTLEKLYEVLYEVRPLIIVYDNDDKGKRVIDRIDKKVYQFDLITLFPVPIKEVVLLKNNGRGGSFEEMFGPCEYIDGCFNEVVMKDFKSLIEKKGDFMKSFDRTKPWFEQIRKFCYTNGFKLDDKKTNVAQILADRVSIVPETLVKLEECIKEIRNKYPIDYSNGITNPLEKLFREPIRM